MDHAAWQKDISEYFAEEIDLHQPKEDCEFTGKELKDYLISRKVVISEKSANTWMNNAEENGDVTSRMWLGGGRRMRLYRFELRTNTNES